MAESENDFLSSSLDEMQKRRISTYKNFNTVEYLDQPVSYSYFFDKYLLPNKLCIIGPWLTKSWLSRKKWKDRNGSPDLDYLLGKFGEVKCPIANCNQEEYSSHPKSEMTFSEYVDYLRRYRESGYSGKMPCLYLKDWHCVRCFPGYKFYDTPLFFQSDWLNEFWDERSDNICDDYRFVYIGPKGSWTPFHSDVLRSYSWSANICGQKKWIFFPPGEEEHLKDKYGQLPFDLRNMETDKYPNLGKVKHRLEVYQNEGEVVFVPSGWHHQVFNLEDTVSVNHNWLNGCNLDICWRFLQQSYSDVMREISDCRDMEGWDQQCQLILKSSSGIDYKEFYNFIELIAKNRIHSLEKLAEQSRKGGQCQETLHLDDEMPHITGIHKLGQDLKIMDLKIVSTDQCVKSPAEKAETSDTVERRKVRNDLEGIVEGKNVIFEARQETVKIKSLSNCREHVVFDLKRIVDILELMVDDEYFVHIYKKDFEVKPKELREKLLKVLSV